jgi:sialate O-acetylesterase
MIQPIIPFGIKGAIWYQGEADGMSEPTAKKYFTLFPALILDWRRQWGQGDFPFLFVQLAGYAQPVGAIIQGAAFPFLRDAQLKTLSLHNTGMAVTIDIGEEKNIHPMDKLDVGRRLALAARHIAYGEHIVYSGPIYKSMQVRGNKIALSFDHIGGGLKIGAAPPIRLDQQPALPGDHLQAFEIAGADNKYVPAKADIQGDSVIVSSDQVAAPIAVRYAWSGYPNPPANLYNREGLPASPFTTSAGR